MKNPPREVYCPYCSEGATLLNGKLGLTEPGKFRYGCDNAHYFVFPEKAGLMPVSVKLQ